MNMRDDPSLSFEGPDMSLILLCAIPEATKAKEYESHKHPGTEDTRLKVWR